MPLLQKVALECERLHLYTVFPLLWKKLQEMFFSSLSLLTVIYLAYFLSRIKVFSLLSSRVKKQ